MGIPRYIDGNQETQVGETGFLVEIQNQNTGGVRWELRASPAHTNQSHEPRLYGWCGTTNNVAVHAHGLATAMEELRNGRLRIVATNSGEEKLDVLERLGYPELMP